MPENTTRAEPTVSDEAPSGAKACIVPVVPQHIPAARTQSVPLREFLETAMSLPP